MCLGTKPTCHLRVRRQCARKEKQAPRRNPATHLRAFGVNASYGEDNGKFIKAVEEINATGGIAGRRVAAVVAEQDQTDQSQEDETREGNEICTRLTEDEHVLMVLNFVLGARYSYECYARHQTPIYPWVSSIDAVAMRGLQPWLLPALWLSYTLRGEAHPIGAPSGRRSDEEDGSHRFRSA